MGKFEEKIKELSKPIDSKNIDFRIQSINKGNYATILAYKDARVDMNRLDKVVGPLNWQRRHVIIDGRLYCEIGIYNPDIKEWVWKMDVGTESKTEQEKGQASDSFKRAGFNWGIGRELYDFPRIQIKLNANEVTVKTINGREMRYAAWDLQLHKWTWEIERDDSGVISKVVAKDSKGTIRYTYPAGSAPTKKKPSTAKKVEKPEKETTSQKVEIKMDIQDSLKRLNQTENLEELKEAWKDVCEWGFGKTKEAHDLKEELKKKFSNQ